MRTTPCTVRCSRQQRARAGRRLASRGSSTSSWMKAASGAGLSVTTLPALRQHLEVPLNEWRCRGVGCGQTTPLSTIPCDTMKEWAKNNCLIMVLRWNGPPPSQVAPCSVAAAGGFHRCVRAISAVRPRGVSLAPSRRSPDSRFTPGSRRIRFTPRRTPLNLVSHNEYFVSTPQTGRANPVGPCSDLWHQYLVAVEHHSAATLVMRAKSHASEWSLWSGTSPLDACFHPVCRQTGSQRSRSAPAFRVDRVGSSARTAQRRVATVTLHMAEQYSNKSVQVSHVQSPESVRH